LVKCIRVQSVQPPGEERERRRALIGGRQQLHVRELRAGEARGVPEFAGRGRRPRRDVQIRVLVLPVARRDAVRSAGSCLIVAELDRHVEVLRPELDA
jgi:hypothetical protein